MNTLARKRSLRLLLVPFLAPLFFIGYIMNVVGESHAAQAKRSKPLHKPVPPVQNDPEMGLIDQIAEPQVAEK